tara:strand:- start:17670 stop:17789 length:120 start_codon:yes stop_codon:yes gene_type:complete
MTAADNLPYLIQTVSWLINSSQNYFFFRYWIIVRIFSLD